MYKFKIFFIIVFLIFPFKLFCDILETSSLEPIKLKIREINNQTLVIFDIDDVIITPKDQILKPAYKIYSDEYTNKFSKKYSETKAQYFWSIIFLERQNELVDPKILDLFNILKKKNIKTILMTNAWTGAFGKIPSLEDWRINELRKFGIDTSRSFKGTNQIIFNGTSSKDPKRFPMYKDGVLFTCNIPKGAILKIFLEKISWRPKNIIFVDDKRTHLESVEKYCSDAGIIFDGFLFTEVQNRKESPLNGKRAALQYEILEKEGKWLSDLQADDYLTKPK